ncbi:MAG: O-methyltransferase [Lachnospiraceae bacterium]|nr:O-methyltransferase [Lachnospiraceae bacterium]
MIVNEHIEDYIDSLDRDLPDELDRLEKWALDNKVPIIRKSMQALLRFLLKERKPEKILEIGAAIGFSTLFLEHYAPLADITTMEKVEMRLVHLRENIKDHPNIRLIEGDASDKLKELSLNHTAGYDFIFLDAAKGQYMSFLEDIRKLIKKGGILVTDNVLLEGSIAESKFSIERRDRTIHKRMREYLYELTHCEDFETVVLPVGDGAALSYFLGGT